MRDAAAGRLSITDRSTADGALPLAFDPREDDAVNYALAIGSRLHGQPPTASGYREWCAVKGINPDSGSRLYAASPISVAPREFAHHPHDTGWLPGGTVVPISGPLAGN